MRQYGEEAKLRKQKQCGKQMKLPIRAERDAINQMEELFKEFTGPLDFNSVEITLYLFEGLLGQQKVRGGC